MRSSWRLTVCGHGPDVPATGQRQAQDRHRQPQNSSEVEGLLGPLSQRSGGPCPAADEARGRFPASASDGAMG